MNHCKLPPPRCTMKYQEQEQDCTLTLLCRLASPALFTAYDYYNRTFHVPVPPRSRDPDCAHACKLLSPARAFEWIYVDGLRKRYGWNATYAE